MSSLPSAFAALPPWSRRAARWLGQIALVVGLYAGLTLWQERGTVAEGAPAPEFVLSSLDGRRISSNELRGQRVLLHFWATWCGVCRAEVSALNALRRDLPRDARLISVVADADDPEGVEAVRRFVRERELQYDVLLADRATLRRFGIRAFPTNYYLDRQGRVRDVTVGMSTRWAMRFRLGRID